ncbi:hypothetical protein OAM04_00605 [bacterium]|nr:hypothetical protein [bacterium]
MKKVASVLVVAMGMFFCVTFGLAIPNSVGGFQNPAGMRFEEFAIKPDSWKRDAKLLGTWEIWSDSSIKSSENIEVLKLSLSAIVFGLKAEEVTAYRKEETVQKFRVDFADGAKTTSSLKTNLGLWADGEWNAAGTQIKTDGTTISLGEGNLVEFVAAE